MEEIKVDGIGRSGISDLLSEIVDIQEYVIDSLVELTYRKRSYIAELFEKSETYKKLFDIQSGYYKKDIVGIIEDFAIEVQDKVGMIYYQPDMDNIQNADNSIRHGEN